MDVMRASVTNERVARDLGVTHSAVSRIRSGDRTPGMTVLYNIGILLRWSLDDQAEACRTGRYAQELEERLAKHYV